MSEWISVDERRPGDRETDRYSLGREYIVACQCNVDGVVTHRWSRSAWYNKESKEFVDSHDFPVPATHWMPLPAPPDER